MENSPRQGTSPVASTPASAKSSLYSSPAGVPAVNPFAPVEGASGSGTSPEIQPADTPTFGARQQPAPENVVADQEYINQTLDRMNGIFTVPPNTIRQESMQALHKLNNTEPLASLGWTSAAFTELEKTPDSMFYGPNRAENRIVADVSKRNILNPANRTEAEYNYPNARVQSEDSELPDSAPISAASSPDPVIGVKMPVLSTAPTDVAYLAESQKIARGTLSRLIQVTETRFNKDPAKASLRKTIKDINPNAPYAPELHGSEKELMREVAEHFKMFEQSDRDTSDFYDQATFAVIESAKTKLPLKTCGEVFSLCVDKGSRVEDALLELTIREMHYPHIPLRLFHTIYTETIPLNTQGALEFKNKELAQLNKKHYEALTKTAIRADAPAGQKVSRLKSVAENFGKRVTQEKRNIRTQKLQTAFKELNTVYVPKEPSPATEMYRNAQKELSMSARGFVDVISHIWKETETNAATFSRTQWQRYVNPATTPREYIDELPREFGMPVPGVSDQGQRFMPINPEKAQKVKASFEISIPEAVRSLVRSHANERRMYQLHQNKNNRDVYEKLVLNAREYVLLGRELRVVKAAPVVPDNKVTRLVNKRAALLQNFKRELTTQLRKEAIAHQNSPEAEDASGQTPFSVVFDRGTTPFSLRILGQPYGFTGLTHLEENMQAVMSTIGEHAAASATGKYSQLAGSAEQTIVETGERVAKQGNFIVRYSDRLFNKAASFWANPNFDTTVGLIEPAAVSVGTVYFGTKAGKKVVSKSAEVVKTRWRFKKAKPIIEIEPEITYINKKIVNGRVVFKAGGAEYFLYEDILFKKFEKTAEQKIIAEKQAKNVLEKRLAGSDFEKVEMPDAGRYMPQWFYRETVAPPEFHQVVAIKEIRSYIPKACTPSVQAPAFYPHAVKLPPSVIAAGSMGVWGMIGGALFVLAGHSVNQALMIFKFARRPAILRIGRGKEDQDNGV